MPRKTDSQNPADWLWIAGADLEGVRLLAEREVGYSMCRSKLAEILEKVMKAELIRLGWPLEKTHDLEVLLQVLADRHSDLAAPTAPLCAALAEVYFTDRYPGFDLEDTDWPDFRVKLDQVSRLFETIQARVAGAGGTGGTSGPGS